MSTPVRTSVVDGIAIVVIDNPPVNSLGSAVRSGLRDAFAALAGREDVRAVVLEGTGRCFSAGAEISEFGKEPPAGTPTLPETIAAIEALDIPVIAAIHGFALGGGLEVTLGAHYRIALPNAKLGLTEVDLGIIPGAGGTQRLPRLIGVEAAANMIAGGERIDARRGAEIGLIDRLADPDAADDPALAFARELIGSGPRRTSERSDMLPDADTVEALMENIGIAVAKRTRGRTAPMRALDAVGNAARLPFADGMAAERKIFVELRDGPEAAALRYLFKAERDAAKIADAPEGFRVPDIERAGVIGLGTMGQDIALVLARAGIEVTAIEPDAARLEAGLEAMRSGLAERVERGRMTQDAMDAELARISGATELAALDDVDLVIEAAIEDMAVKKDIFAALDGICPAHAILSTNTSSLSIDDIAAATQRPDKVAGAHFFAPAQVMKLLEIVRGEKTSPEAAATLMALAKRIGKNGAAVGNGPGFVGNRMYHRYTWQAYFLLQEGAEPAEVDAAMQEFGFPLGCLAVGDISGLDVAWRVRQGQMASGDIDPARPYPVVADRICEKGWFGRKTKRGWYRYDSGKPTPDPDVSALIMEVSAELGIERRRIAPDEIRERCLFALINEGARLLGNGVAYKPSDIDVIWRYGYGFPDWKGGPMFMAREMGREKVLETLECLRVAHGVWFEPAPAIVDSANDALFG